MKKPGLTGPLLERLREAPLEPRHAKLILPMVGVLAGYCGAFVGAWLIFLATTRWWVTAPIVWMCFVAAGLAAMAPVDDALDEKAAHVELIEVPVWWTGAALLLLLLHWAFAAAFHVAIHPFYDNLALWGAGALAIWKTEPGSPVPRWLARFRGR